jgi:hypothetical protein
MGTKVFFKNPVPDRQLPEAVKAILRTLPKAQLEFWQAHRDHAGVRVEKGRVSCRTCNVASKG